MKKTLNIPKFKSAKAEQTFWSQINLSEYFESADFVPAVFPDLQPSSRAISIRLPEYLLVRLKERAHALNIPYQTLIKQFIAGGLLGQKI